MRQISFKCGSFGTDLLLYYAFPKPILTGLHVIVKWLQSQCIIPISRSNCTLNLSLMHQIPREEEGKGERGVWWPWRCLAINSKSWIWLIARFLGARTTHCTRGHQIPLSSFPSTFLRGLEPETTLTLSLVCNWYSWVLLYIGQILYELITHFNHRICTIGQRQYSYMSLYSQIAL